ncbi:glycoside hydrolase [Clostridium novyi A str. 4552]|uniref:Glycoside hydrolase n=1 Tax=Clostridium novyi A str. 4552 TaxID=1444289 RepID=A0A0A0I9X5_CLONO|nr:glycosyltransferase [Clostridium novyi]KGM96435.1 glycoside hydrolase [Clostridium novyi A str. 4552]
MKVLVISSWYPTSYNKVNGIFVKEQVKALMSVGISPIVFFPYDSSIEKGRIKKCIEEGITVYRANTYYLSNSKLSQINSIVKSIRFMKKIINENNISLIHSHVCYPSGFVVAIYNKLYNTPYVITEHMSRIGEFVKKQYNKKLFNFAYSNASKVITVSSSLKEDLNNFGFEFNSEIIHNVVNTDKFYLKEKDSIKNQVNIIFIGSMEKVEVKGLQYFIPALSNFIHNNPQYEITLNLLGDGEYREKYEKMCMELGIMDNCKFWGTVKNDDIPQFIAEGDFLVLPSKKETFGCVLIEAMAGGIPVLATSSGGPKDFINEKVGVLVEPNSIEALEKGLETIITNYDKFDNNYIREYSKQNYSYKCIGNKLKGVYQNILGNDGEI